MTSRKPGRRTAPRLGVETLEDRVNPTTTLYVDFGDRFAGTGLATSVGELQSLPQGPVLTQGTTPLGPLTPVNVQSFNAVYGGTAAAVRANTIAFLRRAYEPLNVTVVDLTAANQTVNGFAVRGAANVAEIQATLNINNATAQHNDAYLIVGRYIVNPPVSPPPSPAPPPPFNPWAQPNNDTGASGPQSAGRVRLDPGQVNATEGVGFVMLTSPTAAVAPDAVPLQPASFLGTQLARLAATSFGLNDAFRGPGINYYPPPVPPLTPNGITPAALGTAYDQLMQSEVQSPLGFGSQGGFNFFTRYPTILGGANNSNQNLLQAAGTGFQTPYDQFRVDPNIGPNPALEFVSGTGTFDQIGVTKTGVGVGTVTVRAFADAAFTTPTPVPFVGGNVYSFNIDLTKPVVIDAGGRGDLITLASDLGQMVTVRGASGADQLVVTAVGSPDVVYGPGANAANGADGNADRQGRLTFRRAGDPDTIVDFQEFDATSGVTINGPLASVRVNTPGGPDVLTARATAANTLTVAGTVTAANVPVVPLSFTYSSTAAGPTLTIDVSAGDVAGNNNDFTLDFAGPGGNPIPAAGLRFIGGLGLDRLFVTADADFGLSDDLLTVRPVGAAVASNVALGTGGPPPSIDPASNGVEIANLTGGGSANTFTVAGWSGKGTLNGQGNTDTVTFTRDADINLTNVNLQSGPVDFNLVSIEVANLIGGGLDNTFDVSGWTRTGSLTGQGGTDTVAASKNVTGYVLADGQLATSDGMSFQLVGVTNATLTNGAANSTFDVSGWTGTGTLNGGTGADTLTATKDEDFTLTNTVLTATDGMSLTLAVASFEDAVLTGGAGDNDFDVGGWSGTGTSSKLTGLGGTDSVTATKDADFILTAVGVTVGGSSFSFGLAGGVADIELANLTGGASDNRFTINGWTGNGTIDGAGSGDFDTLSLSANADFTLDAAGFRVAGGPAFTILRIEDLQLRGGVGANTFTITDYTGGATLDGGGGVDTLNITQDADITLTGTTLTTNLGGVPNATNFNIAGFETAFVNGGAGNNAIGLSGFAGAATLDGRGGDDVYTVTLTGAATGTATIADTGGTANDRATVVGTGGNDTFAVDIAKVKLGGQTVLFASPLASVGVAGTGGDDTFTVDSAVGLFTATALTLDGGAGSNTAVLQGTLAAKPARETVTVGANGSGGVVLDPDGSGGVYGLGTLGADAESIAFTNLAFVAEVRAVTRLDIRYAAPAGAVAVGDGPGGTVVVGGGGTAVRFTSKGSAGIAGGDGPTAFTVNNTTPLAGFTALDLFGSADPAAGLPDDGASDTFDIIASSVPVVADGQAGADTFMIRAATAAIAARGGSGTDTFLVGSGNNALIGNLDAINAAVTVDGGTGTDTLSVSDWTSATANANVSVTAGAITGLAPQPIAYGSFETLLLRGSNTAADTIRVNGLTSALVVATGGGDDAVTVGGAAPVSGFGVPISADGGGGANTFTADDSAATGPGTYAVTATAFAAGATTTNFANFAAVNLKGGGGANAYAINATAAGVTTTVDDGAGVGTFTVPADALAGTVALRGNGGDDVFNVDVTRAIAGAGLTLAGGGGTDAATVNAPQGDTDTVYRVTGKGGAVTGLGATLALSTDLDNLLLDGRGGNNSFTFQDDSDTAYGTAAGAGSGIVYQPTTATGGVVRLAGTGPAVAFANVGGTFTIDGDSDNSGDADVVTVVGVSTTGQGTAGAFADTTATSGADTITVTDSFVSISNATLGTLREVAIDAGSTSTLYVRGGSEAAGGGDVFSVTPSGLVNIVVDGMDPTGGKPGDKLGVILTGQKQVTQTTDPQFGPPQRRITDLNSGASVGFLNFESGAGAISATAVATGEGADAQVVVLDNQTNTVKFTLTPFPGFRGGLSVATGDITGDGVPDIVVGAGNTGGPAIVLIDGNTGKTISSFFAYEASFRGGVQVAAGDYDGDGRADIIAGTGLGGGPRVQVFSGRDRSLLANFFAYEPSFRNGVQVAAGDIDGDGKDDLITGAGAGGGPRVRALQAGTLKPLADFFAFGEEFRGGVFVGGGDINGDGRADIVAGAGTGDLPKIRAYSGTNLRLLADLFLNDPFSPGEIPSVPDQSGVRVAVSDLDGDGAGEIIAGKGAGTRPTLYGIKVANVDPVTNRVTPVLQEIYRTDFFGSDYAFGIFVGGN